MAYVFCPEQGRRYLLQCMTCIQLGLNDNVVTRSTQAVADGTVAIRSVSDLLAGPAVHAHTAAAGEHPVTEGFVLMAGGIKMSLCVS